MMQPQSQYNEPSQPDLAGLEIAVREHAQQMQLQEHNAEPIDATELIV